MAETISESGGNDSAFAICLYVLRGIILFIYYSYSFLIRKILSKKVIDALLHKYIYNLFKLMHVLYINYLICNIIILSLDSRLIQDYFKNNNKKIYIFKNYYIYILEILLSY